MPSPDPHPFTLDETTGRCLTEGCGLVQQATIHEPWDATVQARRLKLLSERAQQALDAHRARQQTQHPDQSEPPDG